MIYDCSRRQWVIYEDAHALVDEDRNELNMAYNFEGIDFGYLPNEYKMPDPKGYDLVELKKIYSQWDSAFARQRMGHYLPGQS